jgi:hypothetical protein
MYPNCAKPKKLSHLCCLLEERDLMREGARRLYGEGKPYRSAISFVPLPRLDMPTASTPF